MGTAPPGAPNSRQKTLGAVKSYTTARRPVTILGVTAATLVGITLSVGLASTSAAAAMSPAIAGAQSHLVRSLPLVPTGVHLEEVGE